MADDTKPGKKSQPIKAVEIRAELRQVKSMVDHTYNVTLNLPEECLPQAQQLMAWIGNELRAVLYSETPN